MPSLVFIWENNTVGHSCEKGSEWPGHASMMIGTKEEADYVSWWPTSSKSFGFAAIIGNALLPRGLSKKGTSSNGFEDDIITEGYLPDHIVHLNTSEEQEGKMRGEWISTKKGYFGGAIKHSYHSLARNCSTVVSRVLLAGGAKTKKWSHSNNWTWTPADVFRLALNAENLSPTAMQWYDFIRSHFGLDDWLIIESRILQSINNKREQRGRDLRDSLRARTGLLCTTGAPVYYDERRPYFWKGRTSLREQLR